MLTYVDVCIRLNPLLARLLSVYQCKSTCFTGTKVLALLVQKYFKRPAACSPSISSYLRTYETHALKEAVGATHAHRQLLLCTEQETHALNDAVRDCYCIRTQETHALNDAVRDCYCVRTQETHALNDAVRDCYCVRTQETHALNDAVRDCYCVRTQETHALKDAVRDLSG
jgi:hypothetical protein